VVFVVKAGSRMVTGVCEKDKDDWHTEVQKKEEGVGTRVPPSLTL